MTSCGVDFAALFLTEEVEPNNTTSQNLESEEDVDTIMEAYGKSMDLRPSRNDSYDMKIAVLSTVVLSVNKVDLSIKKHNDVNNH
ncbi:hypothetical protein RCL_jg9712.t1 [Rhizophagus clarus]|uniref:Uncharacterized protein n=1 Tax=Rhizophagus clarus TaxID=94130 RepID=A0A8H3QX54_9GLOM|nr:hypothetical protein RCL_jg9712.t1 [Rhizophagus clarus]